MADREGWERHGEGWSVSVQPWADSAGLSVGWEGLEFLDRDACRELALVLLAAAEVLDA